MLKFNVKNIIYVKKFFLSTIRHEFIYTKKKLNGKMKKFLNFTANGEMAIFFGLRRFEVEN